MKNDGTKFLKRILKTIKECIPEKFVTDMEIKKIFLQNEMSQITISANKVELIYSNKDRFVIDIDNIDNPKLINITRLYDKTLTINSFFINDRKAYTRRYNVLSINHNNQKQQITYVQLLVGDIIDTEYYECRVFDSEGKDKLTEESCYKYNIDSDILICQHFEFDKDYNKTANEMTIYNTGSVDMLEKTSYRSLCEFMRGYSVEGSIGPNIEQKTRKYIRNYNEEENI